MKNPRQIIGPPLFTEKNTLLRDEQNKYAFQVALGANKIEIRQAIEVIFDVTVDHVRTARMRGKIKRMGRYEGKRPDWKKAIVTLAPDDTIDLFEGV